MKDFTYLLLSITAFIVMANASCKLETSNIAHVVSDTGIVVTQNGKGLPDTIGYTCLGCKSNKITDSVFKTIVNRLSNEAKNNLRYPLTFDPTKLEIVVVKSDSLILFEDNKRLDSVLSVLATYEYNGKNTYGNELEGKSTVSIKVRNGNLVNLDGQLKLEPLSFDSTVDYVINRTLGIYSDENRNDDAIQIIPTKNRSLIVKSSFNCVDEGTWLILHLDNGASVKLTSWNRFNCEPVSYYSYFSTTQQELLKKFKVKWISVLAP